MNKKGQIVIIRIILLKSSYESNIIKNMAKQLMNSC